MDKEKLKLIVENQKMIKLWLNEVKNEADK